MATTRPRTIPSTRTLVAYAPMLVLLLLAGAALEEGLRLLLTVDAAAQADMAGWYVLVLGVVLAVTTCCAERPAVADDADDEADDEHVRPARPRADMLVCLLLVAAYALLLGTLGYVVAGVAVVFGFLRFISRYGWWRSAIYTVVINAVFVALFELTGVVLPAGILTL